MNKSLTAKIVSLLQRRHLKGVLAKIALTLSCMSIFLITYMLVAPVLTQEWEAVCGLEDHIHAESCYEDVPACGLEEAGTAGHEHSDDCYELRGEDVLVCGREAGGGHTHTDDCYTVETVAKYKTVTEDVTETVTVEDTETRDIADEDGNVIGVETVVTGSHEETIVVGTREVQVEDGAEEVWTLTCGEEEAEGHEHDDGCYERREEKVLACVQGHEHDGGCYERRLTCGLEEHTHTDQCYHEAGDDAPDYICGFLTEHAHKESCYFESGELKCTIPEHIHDDSCFSAYEVDRTGTSIFPEELPEGYEEVDIFQFGGMMFAMAGEEESGGAGLNALVYVPQNAFGENVMFVPWPLFEDDDAYVAAAEALAEAGAEYESMTAMDLSFMNEDGEMLEPNTENGPVYVRLTMPMELPEEATELALWHHTGDGAEEVEACFVYEGGTLTVDFAADSFSSYMISASRVTAPVDWGMTSPKVDPVVDDDGVTVWDVSSTTYRYLRIPIRINTSDKMTIQLPRVLTGVGRTPEYDPRCEVEGINNGDWTWYYDEETITIETRANSHVILDIYYAFDCWNVVSDKEFDFLYQIDGFDQVVTGKVVTGHGVTIGEYINDNGNSYYAFDGFGGADKQTAFIPKWNLVYETYFGLKKADFDGGSYVYDLAAFLVEPTGQQPYDISGTFTPSSGGTLVGAVYMMDSSKRPDDLYVTLSTRPEGGGYSFTLANTNLINQASGKNAVVSSSLTDETDNKVYTLYFLVKYPKANMEDSINLTADLTLTHTGVDSTEKRTDTRNVCLYTGPKEPADRIYWASYIVGSNIPVESTTGLTALNKGYTAALDFSADFFCLNENRSNFQDNTAETQLDKYRLEAIVDLSYLSDSKTQLDVGDYQFSSYKLSLVDAAGAWSQNSHGVPNVGWKQDKFGNAPAWAANENIVVYGSKTLTGNDWVELNAIPASEVWAIDKDRAFKNESEWRIEGDGIVRLKVVYNSRLTTALRVGYQMTLKPDGPNKLGEVTSETLNLTNWFDYLAYTADDARDPAMAFNRYPVKDGKEDGWEKDTIGTLEPAREHDKAYPYPGYPQPANWYSQTEYSLRNFAKAELCKSNDVAGMIVTQALYDSNGTIMGDPVSLSPSETFSRQTEVTNVSEVVYSISGVVTNGANSLPDLQKRQEQAGEGSPYQSVKQRYYVLMPRKMKLNMLPENNYGSSSWYLSPYSVLYNGNSPKRVQGFEIDVPVSDGRVDGWKPNSWGNVSEMYWNADGTVELGGYEGQLVMFEREIKLDDATKNDPNYAARYNMWEKPVYFWGRGLSFSIVPVGGTGTLPAGDYTVKFWCQFLDENDEPIPMTDFVTNDDKGLENLDLLESAAGGKIDPRTLLYIPIDFKNHSNASGSKGEIAVGNIVEVKKDGEVVDWYYDQYGSDISVAPEQKYYYELTYNITSGRARDVILWCNLEGECMVKRPNGEMEVFSSEWKGTMTGVDLNGMDNVTVYVRNERFDVEEYAQSAEASWLTSEGWTKVPDPDSYDWANVKAVAFAFSGEFEREKIMIPPSVLIEMKAPGKNGVNRDGLEKTEYIAYNEYVFSDVHDAEGDGDERGGTMVTLTSVTLKLPFELPSTGGAGAQPMYAAGMALILTAVSLMYLNQRRSRKAGEGGRA